MTQQVKIPRKLETGYGHVEWEEADDGVVVRIYISRRKVADAAVMQQLLMLFSQIGARPPANNREVVA
jgi:hypothetical protein